MSWFHTRASGFGGQVSSVCERSVAAAQRCVKGSGRVSSSTLRLRLSSVGAKAGPPRDSLDGNEEQKNQRGVGEEREREIDLEALLLQGEKERSDNNCVFSIASMEEEDWELAEEDWVDSRFRNSIQPITEGDKENLREMGKKIEAAAKPQVETGDGEEESAYSARSGFREIEADELHELLVEDAVTVIDIRSREEYKKVHLEQSINIPFVEFSVWNQTGQLDKYKQSELAIICNTGSNSAQATVRLTKVYGFEEATVYNVKGGINQWLFSGYPTEQGHRLRWHY